MIADTNHEPATDREPSLAIVIVNYNSWPDTSRLALMVADSPEAARGLCELVVVDNASIGPIPEGLEGLRGVRVLRSADNGGFAAGVNTAWRSTDARWLLLLNPDVEIEPDFVARVLGRIDDYELRGDRSPGIVGYALRNRDGSPQHSVGTFPTLGRCLLDLLTPRHRRRYRPIRRVRSGPVPWVTGACMLIRSDLMAELDGMDEEFFLYYEEVALCRSAQQRGWTVEFDPLVSAVHLRPLQGRAVSPLLRVLTRHSKLLYFVKFRPNRERVGLAALIAVEATLRGRWAGFRGRHVERDAWRTIGRIASTLDRTRGPRGIEVRRLAEASIGSGRPDALPDPLEDGDGPIALDRMARCR